MKIYFQDRAWELDELEITNKQAEKIRAHTGLSMQKWLDSLRETEAEAWESSFDALYWLMLQQNEQHGMQGGSIADVDYPVYKFIQAYGVAFAAEHAADEKEAEPDPTQPPADSAPSPAPASPKAKSSGQAAEVVARDG
jgi:hypothetical protein